MLFLLVLFQNAKHCQKISAMKGFFDEMGKHSVDPSPSNYKISDFKKKPKEQAQIPATKSL